MSKLDLTERKNIFTQRLNYVMEQKGFEASDLVMSLTNGAHASVSHWRSGHCMPQRESLIDLADVLQVSIDYLVGRTDL